MHTPRRWGGNKLGGFLEAEKLKATREKDGENIRETPSDRGEGQCHRLTTAKQKKFGIDAQKDYLKHRDPVV